jgi:hypothetical protein
MLGEKKEEEKSWSSQQTNGSISIGANHSRVSGAESGVQGVDVPCLGPAGPIHGVVECLHGNGIVCCQDCPSSSCEIKRMRWVSAPVKKSFRFCFCIAAYHRE